MCIYARIYEEIVHLHNCWNLQSSCTIEVLTMARVIVVPPTIQAIWDFCKISSLVKFAWYDKSGDKAVVLSGCNAEVYSENESGYIFTTIITKLGCFNFDFICKSKAIDSSNKYVYLQLISKCTSCLWYINTYTPVRLNAPQRACVYFL